MSDTPETDALHKRKDFLLIDSYLMMVEHSAKLERERDRWKKAHDNQVNLKIIINDRPDMKERTKFVAKLIKERDGCREALETLQKDIETYYKYYKGSGAEKNITTTQMLNQILQTVLNYKPTKEEYDMEDMKRHCNHYIEALEEITKKNRKEETCQMIALKALGELTDENYQPELLIEENLKLRMQAEDLESKIVEYSIDKVCPIEERKLLDNADKHSKMYP